MDFFKGKQFRKAHKPNPEKDSEDKPIPQPEEPNNGQSDDLGKSVNFDPATEAEDEDDDFIMSEVKRRLKELRKNSFMVLIPEESGLEEEEEEEGETSSSEWRDVEAEGRQAWFGFDAVYDKYCEQMLFSDRVIAQQLKEIGSQHKPATPSPRSASKKLTSPLRCLSLKKMEEPDDETEHLQQSGNDPYQDLETAYVAQVCLTWEALHSEYTQLSQKISYQPENPTRYNHSAQQFQQFQVLLQRYIENEPFEQGLRTEIYARSRNSLPKLLQVPNIQGLNQLEIGEEESDYVVHAPDLIRIIESSILTFHLFLKMEKRKASGVRNLFVGQNQLATPLQQIRSSLEKKEMKLKEVCRRMKGWKKKSWPSGQEGVELFLGLIDVKVMRRVLRMVRITKEQLFWCEEKMKKLDISDGKLQRDPSPILFPC
ncbi:DUF1666 family protein [Actinidia rufa]|uniref:DUF1666 family protein n=1 Tax=Actinidia rufa TaxID=165716 RepID=A0A7J0FF40_9ERIC|nr:DUF1666 family protein [Actinidia rufa]